MFGLDPINLNNPTDKAAMSVLSQFLPMAGDFNRDGHVDASDIASMEQRPHRHQRLVRIRILRKA